MDNKMLQLNLSLSKDPFPFNHNSCIVRIDSNDIRKWATVTWQIAKLRPIQMTKYNLLWQTNLEINGSWNLPVESTVLKRGASVFPRVLLLLWVVRWSGFFSRNVIFLLPKKWSSHPIHSNSGQSMCLQPKIWTTLYRSCHRKEPSPNEVVVMSMDFEDSDGKTSFPGSGNFISPASLTMDRLFFQPFLANLKSSPGIDGEIDFYWWTGTVLQWLVVLYPKWDQCAFYQIRTGSLSKRTSRILIGHGRIGLLTKKASFVHTVQNVDTLWPLVK